MTKKLFVVLVVITAMLISLPVFAAKGKKAMPADVQQLVLPSHQAPPGARMSLKDVPWPAEKADGAQQAQVLMFNMMFRPGEPTPVPLDNGSKQDTCLVNLQNGTGYYGYRGWLVGDEEAEQFCDAELAGCDLPAYPFGITELYHMVYIRKGAPTVTGYYVVRKADMSDPACPKPGPIVWTSPVLSYGPLPYPGYVLTLSYLLDSQVCVKGPFFVGFYYVGPQQTPTGDTVGVCVDNQADICQSYWDWGEGFYDLVADIGFAGNLVTYCRGLSYKDAYNTCPAIPECEYYLWHDGNPYWYYPAYYYVESASWFNSPKTGYIGRARIALYDGYYYGSPELEVTLWDGNPTSGPGTIIDQILVPNSDFVFYPSFIEVDFTDHNVTINAGDYIYLGVVPIDPVEEVTDFAMFADYDGNGVQTHSWWNDGTGWIDEYTAYGDHAEFLYELEICGEAACDTETADLYDYMGPAYVWALPSTSGRNYPNERFSVPFTYGGRLDQIRIGFYNKQGTPSPNIYVWMDDGTGLPLDANPPDNAMASWNVPAGDVVTYPFMQTVNTWEAGIYFDPGEEFHVGYTFDFSNTGDTLSLLSDDYNDESNTSDRASWWWPTATNWQNSVTHYGIYMSWVMEVTLCKTAPPNPTFVLTSTPTVAYISPGDAGLNLYDVTVISVAGYNQNVNLDIVPASIPAGITYNYVPPNGTPLFPSDLYISADPITAVYGTYTLTLRGTGADMQVRTTDVTLIVQPPYDEDTVSFYHGFQRTSNFGAIAHSTSTGHWPNFSWYGVDPLYDGSIISVTPVAPYDEHMALDMYDCVHVGFEPTQHIVITPESYGEVAYSNFFTHEDVVSCEWDSFYVIGLKNVVSTDFSIKIKIYYNPTPTPLPVLYPAVYEDWDISANGAADWATLDSPHNLIYQYATAAPTKVFGIMRAPTDDNLCHRIVSIYNPQEVYPTGLYSINCGNNPGPAHLAELVMNTWIPPGTEEPPVDPQFRGPGFFDDDQAGADDHSVMIVSQPFSLNPGEKHIEVWVDFGRDLTDGRTWEMWYMNILRLAGFYRGDVNANDSLEVPLIDISDLVYLINYQFKDGLPPLPFADQGDVNADKIVDLADVVYLIRYAYRGGPAPIDYVRFIPSLWTRPSLFNSPNW
jgi:hypothetical protein